MIKKFRPLLFTILMVGFVSFHSIPEASAQCPMCKMSAESNLRSGGSHGKGLNAGILFILSLPYLLVGSIGYAWWRNSRQYELENPDQGA